MAYIEKRNETCQYRGCSDQATHTVRLDPGPGAPDEIQGHHVGDYCERCAVVVARRNSSIEQMALAMGGIGG